MSGTGGEIVLPVPWATRRESSFLISVEELRAILGKRGFHIEKLAIFLATQSLGANSSRPRQDWRRRPWAFMS